MDHLKSQLVDGWRMLKNMNARQVTHQFLNLGLILCSALMIWKGLVVITGSESPVVVVLSGSMEPAMFRGDILFLWQGSRPYESGEIVVYKIEGRDIPIVHRVMETHTSHEGAQKLLTKGDNNNEDDRTLYNDGQHWIEPKDVMGRVVGFLPFVGMVTIKLTEYPILKFALVGLLSVFTILSKE